MPRLRPSTSEPWTRRWQNALDHAVEALRDQPLFDVPDPETSPGFSLTDGGREQAYEETTRRVYQRRTRVVALAAMLSLPAFWLLYSAFAPWARVQIGLLHGLMFVSCALVYQATRRARTLGSARIWAAGAYAVFALTAAAVMVVAHDGRVDAFSGHVQIIMSLLLIPFSLGEAFLCALLIVLSYALGLGRGHFGTPDESFWPQIASLFFTGALITILAQLQGVARRRAFDAAFDMAVAASRAAQLSMRDAMTGGFNRRHLETVLDLELARAARHRHPFSLVMFDLDHFKAVNDSLGHRAGDEVLREVLDAATAALRGGDTVARYGGDEFIVVLPETAQEEAVSTAIRLSAQVRVHLLARFGPD
ncbi:MAG: diguanylate cyclase, partial [Armatimonadota bacterium]|nr:diguanylate cyclase [Armatimonadota bacterium]